MADDGNPVHESGQRADRTLIPNVHDALAVGLPESRPAGFRHDFVERERRRGGVLSVEGRADRITRRGFGRSLVRRPVEEIRRAEAVPVETEVLDGADDAERRKGERGDRRRRDARHGDTARRRIKAERERRVSCGFHRAHFPNLVRTHRDEPEVHLAEAREILGRNEQDQPARSPRRGRVEVHAVGRGGIQPAHERERRPRRAARRDGERIDFAEWNRAQARRILARVREERRAGGSDLAHFQDRRRLRAARDEGRGEIRPAVVSRGGELVDEVCRGEISVLLLLPEQVAERGRGLRAARQGTPKRVVVGEVVAVPELVEGEHLERFQEPLLQVETLACLAEIHGTPLDIALQDMGQPGGRGARRRQREAVGKAEEPHVRGHEASRQEIREPRQDERCGRQRDPRLAHSRPQVDRARKSGRARLERRGHALAGRVRNEAELQGLGAAPIERRDRLPERIGRIGLVRARDVFREELDRDEVLRHAGEIRDRDVEAVHLALPHDVRVVEREVEARVDHFHGGLHGTHERQRRAARPHEVGPDVHPERLRPGDEALHRPACRPLLGWPDDAAAVRLRERKLLPHRHGRTRGRDPQRVASRQLQRARHVLKRRVRAVRRAVRHDEARVEELVQERDVPGNDDGAVKGNDLGAVLAEGIVGGISRGPFQLERNDPRRLPADHGVLHAVGKPVQDHGLLVERQDLAAGLEKNGQLYDHHRTGEQEADREAEGLEILLRDRDAARLQVREREPRDGGRGEQDLADVQRGKRRLGVRQHVARRGVDEAHVLEQVVALPLKARQEEGSAGRRFVGDRLRKLRPRKLPHDLQARNRSHSRRAARTRAVTRPDTSGLAHIDRLFGIGCEQIPIDRQARPGDLKLSRSKGRALLRGGSE